MYSTCISILVCMLPLKNTFTKRYALSMSRCNKKRLRRLFPITYLRIERYDHCRQLPIRCTKKQFTGLKTIEYIVHETSNYAF